MTVTDVLEMIEKQRISEHEDMRKVYSLKLQVSIRKHINKELSK